MLIKTDLDMSNDDHPIDIRELMMSLDSTVNFVLPDGESAMGILRDVEVLPPKIARITLEVSEDLAHYFRDPDAAYSIFSD